jgi:hemolysin activation/secretion protein
MFCAALPWPALLCVGLLCATQRATAQSAPTAPAAAVEASEQALTAVGAIELSRVDVQGATVFTEQELEAITAPYERELVTFESLQELRHELSQQYVERGYVTSGVVIPEQRVTDGVVVLQAVEGELAGIEVEGNRRLRSAPIERRVEHYVDRPLNVADLQAGLSFLQKDPLVERVNAELVPGERLGESVLRIGVTERKPFELTVIAANDRAPSLGEHRASLALTYRGLVGNGDVLSGRFGVSDGADDNALYYHVPFTPGGTALDIAWSDQDADIVEEPFDEIDISSRIEAWSVTASRTFADTGARTIAAHLGFEHKRSESTLLDAPFSFSPGDIDGKARGSALLLGAEWSRTSGPRLLVARGTFQVGVDVLDPTDNPVPPDGDFTLFLGQLQLSQRLSWRDSQVLVRGLLQLADDPLLAIYKLPIGGRYTVRGYRESELVRDNGFAASAEYRFSAFVDDSGQRRGQLDLAVFTDFGVSEDERAPLFGNKREQISSAGIGLLWHPLPGLNVEIYRAEPLEDREEPEDESLQDRGIHYSLVYRRAF